MNTKKTALKELAVKLGCAASINDIPGKTISEVIQFIEENAPFGVSTVRSETIIYEKEEAAGIQDSSGVYYTTLSGYWLPSTDLVVYYNDERYEYKYLGMNSNGKRVWESNILNLTITQMTTDYSATVYLPSSERCTIKVAKVVEEQQVKTLDPKFLPVSTVYINSSIDRYLYKDESCTEKFSAEDLDNAFHGMPCFYVKNLFDNAVHSACYVSPGDLCTTVGYMDTGSDAPIDVYTSEYVEYES